MLNLLNVLDHGREQLSLKLLLRLPGADRDVAVGLRTPEAGPDFVGAPVGGLATEPRRQQQVVAGSCGAVPSHPTNLAPMDGELGVGRADAREPGLDVGGCELRHDVHQRSACKLVAVTAKVVPHHDEFAQRFSAVRRAPESAADHLPVQARAEGRPGDEDPNDGRR